MKNTTRLQFVTDNKGKRIAVRDVKSSILHILAYLDFLKNDKRLKINKRQERQYFLQLLAHLLTLSNTKNSKQLRSTAMENSFESMTNFNKWNCVSEIELVYKSKVKPSERPVIKTSNDAYQLMRHYYNQNTLELKEQFCVLYLNRASKALAIELHSVGGMTGTVADIRLILATALKLAASGMILSHCHPSGSLQPSRQDELLTRKVKEAASIMDIRVCDHLILSSEGYLSMTDEAIIWMVIINTLF